ncbi:hypothetical protein BT93_L3459 [Corymbia citriodora subsp. variegata]|uniref:Cytochrome P450 n=1 Tax=Corymbia citriodora subsp. variegata TaxID=360336 RepID=A0A8T0CJN6_CORYI|nr:hypothetical protein BT93_L3459 [Corymbia citriodora subsp. variegata]
MLQNCHRELLGDGIFAVDGHLWSLQCKIASHEFTTRSLKHFISETVGREISDRLLPFLSRACDEGRVFDLQEALQRFTFDNICSVVFGVDPNCFAAEEEAWEISVETEAILQSRVGETVRIEHKSDQRVRDGHHHIERGTNRIGGDRTGEQRRDGPRSRAPIWSKDSTSTALTWLFWLIAAHPSCEREILKELSSTAAEVKIFSYDELKSLHYLHAAVTESMRLFPPVPINSRLTVDDDVLPDGTRVGKGWFADYSAYAMGRSEEVWGPDCREFKPERWLDGGDGDHQNVRFRPSDQWKYPVFHCGPRMCLGKEMAYVQMKSVAAAVMAEFEVLPAVDGGESARRMADPPYTLSLLLKMRGGLPVRLRRRRRRD